MCWDSERDAPTKVGISSCHHGGGHQLLRINTKGQLGIGERCVEADHNDQVELTTCPMGKVDGPWEYAEVSRQMKHRVREKCVEHQPDNSLYLKPCSTDEEGQIFEFQEVIAH